MKLENIRVNETGSDLEKVLEAVKALPDGTVKGISGYGFFTASLTSSGAIQMGDFDPTTTDEISYKIPNDAEDVKTSGNTLSFKYKGRKYLFGTV